MNAQGFTYQLHESRIFGATPAAVYRAFVDPLLLAAWYPRAGWSMPPEEVEIDPRPGGRLRYVLVSTRDPARRAVRSAEISDSQEGSFLAWTKEPLSGSIAGERVPARRVRVEFRPESHGRTCLVLREGPLSEAAEIDARECWNCSFSRLDRVLADMTVLR
jgi:uncharacterized protein YndB with AHSA1/START domain